jgi:hypothetical protein
MEVAIADGKVVLGEDPRLASWNRTVSWLKTVDSVRTYSLATYSEAHRSCRLRRATGSQTNDLQAADRRQRTPTLRSICVQPG